MVDYADIAVATDAWTGPITLTEAQIWQAKHGTVRVSTKADPVGDTGIQLAPGDAVQIASGRSVFYRGVNAHIAPGAITRENLP